MSKYPDVLKSACNVFALMDMGMTEAAATRVAKQWEDKCAEAEKLRTTVEAERERCARLALKEGHAFGAMHVGKAIAKAIRARPH